MRQMNPLLSPICRITQFSCYSGHRRAIILPFLQGLQTENPSKKKLIFTTVLSKILHHKKQNKSSFKFYENNTKSKKKNRINFLKGAELQLPLPVRLFFFTYME